MNDGGNDKVLIAGRAPSPPAGSFAPLSKILAGILAWIGGHRRTLNERIVETSLDLILVVDRQGTFKQVNPSALSILGYRPSEMVGRSAVDFLYPDDLENTR